MPEPVSDLSVPGARGLEHTADVGFEVEAPDPAELFRRAALAMTALILEAPPPEPTVQRELCLDAADVPSLLVAWLRELLYWHEVDGFAFADATFGALSDTGLEAAVRGGPDPTPPVREIKGVTYHGLIAERRPNLWYARVIFDV
ncbi:MAG: archease [Gemmatimonadetes bacterium]|nr:archease [Gemmatimonadota bacterium]